MKTKFHIFQTYAKQKVKPKQLPINLFFLCGCEGCSGVFFYSLRKVINFSMMLNTLLTILPRTPNPPTINRKLATSGLVIARVNSNAGTRTTKKIEAPIKSRIQLANPNSKIKPYVTAALTADERRILAEEPQSTVTSKVLRTKRNPKIKLGTLATKVVAIRPKTPKFITKIYPKGKPMKPVNTAILKTKFV